MDLLDYDFNIAEHGWQEASISIADVILGSSQNGEEFADILMEAYLAGANKYDVPLQGPIRDPSLRIRLK